MTSTQLPNYLRAYRKRAAMSQDDVAFLMGNKNGSKVCRNERYVREPSLETAFAYEVIYQQPARELFGGLYHRIEDEVAARARTLTSQTDLRKPGQRTTRRRQILTSIAAKQPVESLNQA